MGSLIPKTKEKRIIVIGGGFAGINFVQHMNFFPCQIVMIDKKNYHTFQPLLYQVATAGLEADSISYPLRGIFNNENFVFRIADVLEIYPDKKQINTTLGIMDYDYLVIATGSKTNYFGNKRLEQNTWPMKSVPEALNLRSLLIQNFEDALISDSMEKRRALMHYVIVGAGPTGVELAGALAELKSKAFRNDYPELELDEMEIWLAEAGPRVLGAMSQAAGDKAKEYLEKMGVKVMLNTKIDDYDGETLVYNGGERVKASTVIWAAGVAGNNIKGIDPSAIHRSGRILVDDYNEVVGHPDIYAIGDVSLMITDLNPKGHPMLAQVAIQQGQNLAKNFTRDTGQKTPFQYKDLGSMATIGKNRAVVDLPKWKFQGVFAWFVWMFVHLMSLIGFRNRFITFVNWFYSYFKYDKGIRLIIRPVQRKLDKSEL